MRREAFLKTIALVALYSLACFSQTIDRTCPPELVMGDNSNVLADSNTRMGQSFLVSCDGTLSGLRVFLRENGNIAGIMVTLDLFTGSGWTSTSTPVRTATVTGFPAVSTGAAFGLDFTFPDLAVTAGTTLTLRLTHTDATTSIRISTPSPSGAIDYYTSGQRFQSALTGNSGVSGSANRDMYFQSTFAQNSQCLPDGGFAVVPAGAAFPGTGSYRGQTATFNCAGEMTHVFVRLGYAGGSATVRADVFAGNSSPGTTVGRLAFGTTTITELGSNRRNFYREFVLNTPVPITPGDQFAISIVVESVTGTATTVTMQFDSSDGYFPAPDSGFTQANGNPSFPTAGDAFMFFTVAPPSATTGTAAGDPHFVGMRGQHFDFDGLPNTVFNLFSTATVQVNALFTKMEIFPGYFEGTYLHKAAVMVFGLDDAIVVDSGNSSFDDQPTLHIGNRTITPSSTNATESPRLITLREGVAVSWQSVQTTSQVLGIPDARDRVIRIASVFVHGVCHVQIYCVENGMGFKNGTLVRHTPTARRNLDVRITLDDPTIAVHGVIGVTNDKTLQRPPGTEEDYVVEDGLFGTHFKHNLYQPQQHPRH